MKIDDIKQLVLDVLNRAPLRRHQARAKAEITVSDVVRALARSGGWINGYLVRAVASILLEAVGGPGKLIGDLLDLISTADGMVRITIESIIYAMAELPEWEMIRGAVISELISALEHENPAIRAEAAFLLGTLRDVNAMRPLLRKINDPDLRVRREVKRTIFQLLPAVGESDELMRESWLLALSEDPDLGRMLSKASFILGELNRRQISKLARITAEESQRVDQTMLEDLIRWCLYHRELCDIAFAIEVFRFSSPDTRSKLWSWLRKSVWEFGRPKKRYPLPDTDHAAIVREALSDPDHEIRFFAHTAAALIEEEDG